MSGARHPPKEGTTAAVQITLATADVKQPAENYSVAPIVLEIDYESPPPEVDIQLLERNGKLFTDEKIAQIKKTYTTIDKHKKSLLPSDEKTIQSPYSIAVFEDDRKVKRYFAVFTGKIGKGGFGSVRIFHDLDSGRWYSGKLQKKSRSAKNEIKLHKFFGDFVGTLTRIKVPKENKIDVAQKSAVKDNKDVKDNKTDTKETPYEQTIIIKEYARGKDLLTLLEKQDLDFATCLDIIRKTLHAVSYCHQNGIIHCDIKPQNIIYNLLTKILKLIDWGAAEENPEGRLVDSVKGTPMYTAPEIMGKAYLPDTADRRVEVSTSGDVYSLGMTFAQLLGLVKFVPWTEAQLSKIENPKIRNILHHSDMQLLDEKDNEYKHNLTIIGPHIRLQVLHYLKRMTKTNPDERGSVEDAITFFETISHNFISAPSKFKKIAFLNAEEFLEGDERCKDRLTDMMQHFDEIIVVCPSRDIDPIELIQLRVQLEKQRIQVQTKFIVNAENNTLSGAQLAAYAIPNIEKRNFSNQIFAYAYLTMTQPTPHDKQLLNSNFVSCIVYDFNFESRIRKHMEQMHLRIKTFDEVTHALQDDIERLRKKYEGKNEIANTRIKKIEQTIETIQKKYNSNMLTFGYLFNQLTLLQNEMLSTARVMGKIFKTPKTSHSYRDMETVKRELPIPPALAKK